MDDPFRRPRKTEETMTDKPSVIRETDDEARALARRLLRSARYVALAVLEPETGYPSVSRVLLATDTDGSPVILVSALRQPFAVSRGTTVQLVFDGGALVLRAAGTPLQDASVGELIKVRNKDSGVIVSGTVMADGTVHVVAK